jgi:septal ring factor EnvC (AmiA/AmiB activator)
MRTFVWLIAAVSILAAPAMADDKPNPDQLKKAYDDTLIQLKAAQDSKNDLAKQNEKLTKQVEDLQKQLASNQQQITALQRQVADNDQRTFELKSYQAAWRNFLRAHPEMLVRWRLFLGEDALALPQNWFPMADLTTRPVEE